MTLVHDPDAHHLGKLDPKPPHIHIATYLDVERAKATEQVPTTVNNSINQSIALAMYLNDREGDCTCAGVGNILRVDSRGKAIVADQDVQSLYITVTKKEGAAFDPTTGANDNGCVPLDVLDEIAANGIGGIKILGHAGVNMKDDAQKAVSLQQFGHIYMGVQLATEQQSQQVWDYVQGSSPGSWGGHLFPLFDLVIVNGQQQWVGGTWGAYKWATDPFVTDQADEGHVFITQAWVDANADNPLFDMQALVADLNTYQHES